MNMVEGIKSSMFKVFAVITQLWECLMLETSTVLFNLGLQTSSKLEELMEGIKEGSTGDYHYPCREGAVHH